LDIRNGNEKIIDVATKYCYESQSSFSRAFKDFHGCTPKSARNNGTNLKHHPKISFSLMIKGVNKMDFRLIDKDSFVICGLKGLSTSIPEKGDHIDPLWREFMNEYNERLYNGDDSYYHEPLWQVGAYSFESRNNGTQCIIGSELGDKPVLDGMDIEEIPESTWAVFKIVGLRDKQFANGFDETYTRIHTEWFPSSGYKRDESMCHLEVFGPGDANSVDYEWEIWIPVVNDDKS